MPLNLNWERQVIWYKHPTYAGHEAHDPTKSIKKFYDTANFIYIKQPDLK